MITDREIERDGKWECRAYGDGWITFPSREEAEKYQDGTGALMRYTRLYSAKACRRGITNLGTGKRMYCSLERGHRTPCLYANSV